MKRSTKKKLGQLWGYILLAGIGFAWFGSHLGPRWIVALSAGVVFYALFQAPMWCCAINRTGELCRNNAYGLLIGCHLKHHKWQKFKMAVSASSWGGLFRRVLSGIGGQAAALSAVAASVSAVAGVVAAL